MSTNNPNNGLAEDVKVKSTDMVLPATLLFLILYYPLCLLMDIAGLTNIVLSTSLLMAFYGILCAVLYWVKHYRIMNNLPITNMVKLIDSNVGSQTINWLIVTLSLFMIAFCIYNGHYMLYPAFTAITFGFLANMSVGQKLWTLQEPSAAWRPHHSPNFSPAPPAPSGKKIVSRTFSWTSILNEKGISITGRDTFEVEFAEPDYLDDQSADYVRVHNPFYTNQPASDTDYSTMAAQVKNGSGDPYEITALSQIIQSAEDVCDKYHLAEYEMYDLLLKFCQMNIEYKVDDECDSIGRRTEYFRFPGETLFDLEGDCDCKSVLAYSLFSLLGADAELVTVCINSDHNPNHLRNHAALILKNNPNKVKLPPTYPLVNLKGIGSVVFCDATAEGMPPGEYSPDMDLDSVTII